MELTVFARLYAREGQQDALAALLVGHLGDVRATPGCLAIHDYRSIRDPRLLYIHSHWTDQVAFEKYARLPNTDRFVQEVEKLMDHPPLQATRTKTIGDVHERTEMGRAGLFIFARFHACVGSEDAVAGALRDVHGPTNLEPECLVHQIYRSIRDPRLYYVHSLWKNEAAFDKHVELPHTVHFVQRVEKLIDHPLEVTRAKQIG